MQTEPIEAQVRQNKIDRQLEQAGWSASRCNLLEELLLVGPPKIFAEKRSRYKTAKEFADYALVGQNGKPIAIVEAKRTSRNPLEGEHQAVGYAEKLQEEYGVKPFIFLANGNQIWFLDEGRYPVRQINGFYSPDDLERLDFQRRYSQPLSPL
jgi:type I restriction enzyme, R subunit